MCVLGVLGVLGVLSVVGAAGAAGVVGVLGVAGVVLMSRFCVGIRAYAFIHQPTLHKSEGYVRSARAPKGLEFEKRSADLD